MATAAVDTSLAGLLSTLTTSLSSAVEIIPSAEAVLPPKEGISLLDVKNELLLSYLQHLAFLILVKLRNKSTKSGSEKESKSNNGALDEDVVKKLVELRVYLEKGIRPLEGRLKYQVDKVIRAAEDADRAVAAATGPKKEKQSSRLRSGANEDADGDSDNDDASDAGSIASDSSSSVNELAYRPNPAAFARAAADKSSTEKTDDKPDKSDGIYRPPRITATAMPTKISSFEQEDRAGAGRGRKTLKSATLDEFVANELSTAPVAQPSIGSTIVAGGRRTKSATERAEEADRRRYEEENFVRLAKDSKKDKERMARAQRAGYGGEEWRELGAGVDRIDRLTKAGKGSGKGALERSRKRPVEDGPRGGDDFTMGRRFEKRRKTVERHRK